MHRDSMYQKLVEHMAEAVWVGDENERTVYANPKFCKLLGYSLEEIIGKESYMFWDSESADKVRDINTHKRRRGESSSYEWNLLSKTGKKIPVLANGTPLPGWGTTGIMTDLTELKAKEENEKVLYNAIQYSTDAIIICDSIWQIISWNKGALIIFGYKSTAIIGKNISLLFAKKDIESILQSTELINKYEISGKYKNKGHLRISVTQTPIHKSWKNTASSYLLICRDITNHRKIEEEIESKYKKIREVYENIWIIKRQSDYIFDLLDIYNNYYYDTKSIGDFIVTSVIMLTRVDACALRFYDKKLWKMKIISSFGFQEWWEGKSMIKFEGSLAQKAFISDSPLKIIDLNKEPLYQSISLARKNNITSLLLIPLRNKWEFIGSISLYAKADKKLEIFENDFIEKYAKVIQIILSQAADF
jgi:PAS domain S-box-containing protein